MNTNQESQELLLKASNLSLLYRQPHNLLRALNEFSYIFKPGKSYAICGPSGSGKTSLLKIIGFNEARFEGEIGYLGEKFDSKRTQNDFRLFRMRNVGYVFQSFELLDYLTAAENIALPAEIAGTSHSTAIQIAKDSLRELGLTDRAHHLPSEMSGGEKQRVAVARALINRPRLLLADEPTGSLDKESARLVSDKLLSYVNQESIVIIATHSHELSENCDVKLVLNSGRLADVY